MSALLSPLACVAEFFLMSFYVFKKELKTYFFSPIAYIVAFALTIISGWFFYALIAIYRRGDMGNTLHNMGVILLLLIPILTMRLFAEERRNRTIELLFTSPVSFTELVVGKYVACVFLVTAVVSLTLLYPFFLHYYGATTDWGPIKTGYLGLFLLSSAFVAIGLFCSTLTDHPLVAAVLGFAFAIGFWVIGYGKMMFQGTAATILEAVSLLTPYDDFVKGVIELKGLVFYVSVIFVFLFASVRMLMASRWR